MKRVELIIEGTVGAGKTSLIKLLSKRLSLKPFYELSDSMVESFLPSYYENKNRWAFTLQVLFLIVRFEQMKNASKIGKAILDRSIFGDVVFAKMLHKSGYMNDHEFSVYERIYNSLVSIVSPPKLMVYIKVPTDLAISRIKERNRDFEISTTDDSYWHKLNAEYERFFRNYNHSCLLVINADKYDWVHKKSDAEMVVNSIKEFLYHINSNKKRNCRFEI